MLTMNATAGTGSTTDSFPSGTWGFGPVAVTWSLTSGNEADVTVSVLGIPIDKLSGSIKAGTVTVEDDLNVLGIVKGQLELQGKSDGLYISGDLKAANFDLPFNHRLISW